MSKTPGEARATGAFIISRLSSQLVRDVVTPQILEHFQLSGERTLQLTEQVSINLDQFNAAISMAASQGSAPLSIKDADELLVGSVSVENDGAVVLDAPGCRWRIAHAALLSMDVNARRQALSQILRRHTLESGAREEVVCAIGRESLTNEQLLDALDSLNGSPESFCQQLGARLQAGAPQISDFLPQQSGYWANITARCQRSKTLAEFVAHELSEQQIARIEEDVQRGFVTVAYSFAATELVPFERLRTLDTNIIVQGLKAIVSSTDHPFALAGAFEICADALVRSEELGALGEQILEKLFADPHRLVRRCKFLSAIFLAASAQLAMQVETQVMPAFWRRIAAVAHAGWVMRVCGSASVDESKFLRWVMRERGQEYMLSAFHDMREQPRWQPEWIDAEYLVPDIFGRAYAALARPEEGAPGAWRERVGKMKSWIEEQGWDARTGLPSVLQGSREREMPRLEGQMAIDMRAAFEDFSRAPSLDGLLGLAIWIDLFGLGVAAIPGAKVVLQQLRSAAGRAWDSEQSAAIAICTRLAVANGDQEFAQAIADTHLERFRSQGTGLSTTQLVFQLVECGAADLDYERGLDALASRLASLAVLLAPGAPCGELLVLLDNLQRVDRRLAPRLARAVHAARAAMAAPKFSWDKGVPVPSADMA